MSIDQIRAREQAATEGPWRLGGSGIIAVSGVEYITSCIRTDPDAEFIAHARQDVPALLAAVDAVLALADYWDTLAPGDQYYADKISAAITRALDTK